MAFDNTMPTGAMAPFQIDSQPVKGGVLSNLSWQDAAEAYWHQQQAFPVIVDATGQTIEYSNGSFGFTPGIVEESPNYSKQFNQGGFVVTWDNGSGHREWACVAQPTEDDALLASQVDRSQLGAATVFDYQIEKVQVIQQVRSTNYV